MPIAQSGETFATAKDLTLTTVSQTFDGSIASTSKSFFGRFTLGSRSSILLNTPTSSLTGAESADIALLDTNGAIISVGGSQQVSDNQGALPNYINTVLDPGTYYIRVFASNIQGATNFFSLNYQATAGTVAAAPPPYDIAGNTLATALDFGTLDFVQFNGQPWANRGSYRNVLSSTNAEDLYRFRVSSPQLNFNLALTGLQSNADVQLVQDLNSNGLIDPVEISAAIASSNRSGNSDEAINRILSTGDYLIRVNQVEGATPYTLSLSTMTINELIAGQVSVPLVGEIEVGNLGTTPRIYSGTFDATNTLDTYRFALFDSSTFNLQLTGLTENADVKLYNSNGTLLQSAASSGITAEQMTQSLEAGTYYVQVLPRGIGSYTLNLSSTPILPTSRVSVASDESQGWGEHRPFFSSSSMYGSYQPAINADGHFVAFTSYSSNLVTGDVNGLPDVFVRDRLTGETTCISLGADGKPAGGVSPSISADGRFVAFLSRTSNQIVDSTESSDVFVHDRLTGQQRRVSVASDGTPANGVSWDAVISADGGFVVFTSHASNLVSGDTNGSTGNVNPGLDVFVHELATGQTSRVNVATDGTQANNGSSQPAISADGRYITFSSFATNLVPGDTQEDRADVFVHDRATGQTSLVSAAIDGTFPNGESFAPSISADGRYISFTSYASLVAEDTNNTLDVFVRDLVTGQTTRVNVDSNGSQSSSYPPLLNPTGPAMSSFISADGRYVGFSSRANDLVTGDTNNQTDMFVHDRTTGETTRVSLGLNGAEANADSGRALYPDYRLSKFAISANGRHIAYTSAATNLVDGDTNNAYDVFVYDQG